MKPGSGSLGRARGNRNRPTKSPRHGKNFSLPKGAIGSGGSATATAARRTACSIASSASTCKTSTKCWASEPPTELARAHPSRRRHAQGYSEPTGLLKVKVDGRRSYFKWINAGHYVCGGSRGTMSMVTQGCISDLYFGFDTERLLVRLDSAAARFARATGRRRRHSRRSSSKPEGFELLVTHPEPQRALRAVVAARRVMAGAHTEAAGDQMFELAVPFRSLARKTDEPVHIYVELLKDKQAIERIPHEGAIETVVPSPDYELIMWQA